MARLNEPPVESIESLKRRFIRQNRELARSNSVQSVKIRNLETQIAQLVADNVSLRAHIIQLQTDLENRDTLATSKNIDAVRRKLEDKLSEFQSLVSQLSTQKPTSRRSSDKASPRSSKRSPVAPKFWAEHRGELADPLGAREGWLPTISEGKQFPRKTMEASELQTLINNQSSDSPEIGPPPRTSVDSPDRSKQIPPVDSEIPTDESSLSSLFSVNLESRRKRRETSVRRDTALSSEKTTSPSKDHNKPADLLAAQPVRAGSKRKLDATYRPATDENASTAGKDSLVFKTNLAVDEVTNISPTRSALAPKSVNTDPVVSPKKITVQDKQPEPVPEKPRSRVSVSRRSSHHLQKRTDSSNLDPDNGASPTTSKTEPKTPAPLDLFSPESVDHSEVRPEGRGDTPPPADLSRRSTATRTEEASGGRTSRRARAGVNYAEPNLISKMRRPTKDLVAAVDYNKARSSTTPAADSHTKSQEGEESATDGKRTVVINAGHGRDSLSNLTNKHESVIPEPQSPLVAKKDSSEALSLERATGPKTERSTQNKTLGRQGYLGRPLSSLEDAGLETAQSKGTKNETNLPEILSAPGSASVKEEIDVFDVGPSPPRPAFTVNRPKLDGAMEGRRPLSSSSRQSISRTDLSSKVRGTQSAAVSTAANSSTSTLSRARSRRQTLGTGTGSRAGGGGKTESSALGPTEGLKTARSSSALRNTDNAESESMDNRLAGRRRSMMV